MPGSYTTKQKLMDLHYPQLRKHPEHKAYFVDFLKTQIWLFQVHYFTFHNK